VAQFLLARSLLEGDVVFLDFIQNEVGVPLKVMSKVI
jgi:hypothetical protein